MRLFKIKMRLNRRNGVSSECTHERLCHNDCTIPQNEVHILDRINAMLLDFDSAHYDDTEPLTNRDNKTSTKQKKPMELHNFTSKSSKSPKVVTQSTIRGGKKNSSRKKINNRSIFTVADGAYPLIDNSKTVEGIDHNYNFIYNYHSDNNHFADVESSISSQESEETLVIQSQSKQSSVEVVQPSLSPFPIPPLNSVAGNHRSGKQNWAELERISRPAFSRTRKESQESAFSRTRKESQESASEEPQPPQAVSPDQILITTDLQRFPSTLRLSIRNKDKSGSSNVPDETFSSSTSDRNKPTMTRNMTHWPYNYHTSSDPSAKSMDDTSKLINVLEQVVYSSWFPIAKLKAEHGKTIGLQNITKELSKHYHTM